MQYGSFDIRFSSTMMAALSWAAHVKGCQWTSVEYPSTLAGKNVVLLLRATNGEESVLRVSPGLSLDSGSGAWIREQLGRAGVVVPKELASTVLVENNARIALQSRVPGQDLACVWHQLNNQQALGIAQRVATLVHQSCYLFAPCGPQQGFGVVAPCGQGTHVHWFAYCQAWLQWSGERAQKHGMLNSGMLQTVADALYRQRAYLLAIVSKTFVWDVAERNVMVLDGQFSGVVDQDDLFHGDMFVAPALALCQLSLLGVPWAREYATHWAQSWGAGEQQMRAMHLYASLYALQAAGKGAKILPDQRAEACVNPQWVAGLIEEWLRL